MNVVVGDNGARTGRPSHTFTLRQEKLREVRRREGLEKSPAIRMLDVHFPTTDGRQLIFRRYGQPERDHKMLLAQLDRELPQQSPPRITAGSEMLPA